MPKSIHKRTEPPRRIHMLVVDDSEVIRIALQRFFEAHATVEIVGVAADGRAGVDTAEMLRPDLVLTDFRMPRMNGLEVTRWLVEHLPAIRVLVMSLDDDEVFQATCAKSGAHGFVSKLHLHSDLAREIGRLFGFPL